MADLTTLRRSPLDGIDTRTADGGAAADRAVRLVEWPFLGMISVRVDPASDTARRLEAVLGTTLPSRCGEVTHHGAHTVLWLGPDEWLVVSQFAAEPLVDDLRAAASAADGLAQVVDVSANRTVLELTGPRARAVLEKGCPVDLHPRVLADDTALTTTLARVPLLLWKVDESVFRLLPRASFTPYVALWLLDAMQEFLPAGGS